MTSASPLSAPDLQPLALPAQGPHGRLGVLVCGHGSRNRLAVGEFASLASSLRRELAPIPLEYGYLEFARPILRDGLEALRQQGVEHVLAVPAMLFAAGHTKNDIPSVLNTYAAETGLRIDYGRELGVDRRMILAAGARIRDCLQQAAEQARQRGEEPVSPAETLLVVVGRGSSDPDANSNVAKVTRMLVEGFGFGWGETLYSGVTFPLVEPGLRAVVKLGFRQIVVFPYFLFSGVLVSRIRQHSQRVADDHPTIAFLQAGYLGDHPEVLGTFRERVEEVLRGDTDMNCSLCKYRAQVLGFEREVGLPQHSHHHHVEGLVESCTLCQSECTGACQEPQTATATSSHSHAPGPTLDPGLHHSHRHSNHQSHHNSHSHNSSHDHNSSHGHNNSHDDGDSNSLDDGHSRDQDLNSNPTPSSTLENHPSSHDHGGSHDHDNSHHHENSHNHDNRHDHENSHNHENSHSHSHAVDHSHNHDHCHSHDHSDSHDHRDSHDHSHTHDHSQREDSPHHPPYPHADHPLGPRTLRQPRG